MEIYFNTLLLLFLEVIDNFVVMKIGKQVYNNLSRVLSTAVFSNILENDDKSLLSTKLDKYNKLLKVNSKTTIKDLLCNIYDQLYSNYRFEYIYKNILLNKLVSEKKLNTTTVLNELRIGKSIADTVFINGESVLYEIKTELDNPDKLITQLEDYKKAFKKINVVTHHSVYYKYYLLLRNTNIGLLYLNEDGALITMKDAIEDASQLDHTYLFKLLRKDEYISILKEKLGFVPDVPNTRFFKESLELSKGIDIYEYHELVFSKLKLRGVTELHYLYSEEIPKELKYICYVLDLSEKEYNTLFNILRSPVIS